MKKHEQHVVFVIIRLTKINLLIADCVVFCLWLVTDRQPRSFRTRLFAEVHMSNMIWSMIHASPGLGKPWVAPKEPAPFRASSSHSHVWLIQSWQLELSWNAWHGNWENSQVLLQQGFKANWRLCQNGFHMNLHCFDRACVKDFLEYEKGCLCAIWKWALVGLVILVLFQAGRREASGNQRLLARGIVEGGTVHQWTNMDKMTRAGDGECVEFWGIGVAGMRQVDIQ